MKSTNIILRISPEQKKEWERYAKTVGISVGELIRSSVESAIPRSQATKRQGDK